MSLTLRRSLRRSRLTLIAALIGLGIAVTACTQPAGGSSGPGGATSSPAAPPSAAPTRAGY
jgi:hypothetical protein